MPAAKKFVTQEQHNALAAEVRVLVAIERLTVRAEVISHDTNRLRREAVDLRDEMNRQFEKLAKQIADGNAALLAAIGRTTP